MKLLVIVIFVILLSNQPSTCEDVAEKTEDEAAVELTESTFEDYITNNSLVLVMFYAPWCGHCKRMKPIFNEVAKILEDNPNLTEAPIKLAQVDVTMNKELGEKYNVFRFPTLTYFRGNFYVYPYEGVDTDAKSILKYIKQEAVEKWIPPDRTVKDLTIENFDEWIANNYISLVEFYTPKCVICQRLEQEFEHAAKLLLENDVHLGRVDCSKEFILKSKFHISRYPILYIFRGGRHYEYTGEKQEYNQIVEFMKKYTRSHSKEIKSFAEFKTYIKNPVEHFVIGLFNNNSENLYEAFLQFSSRYPDDFHMFHLFDISDFEKSLKVKIQRPSVIVYYHDSILTKYDSNFRIFSDPDANADVIEDFIMRESLPLIGVINNENKKHIYKDPRPICYAFYSLDFFELLKNTLYYRDKLIPVARKNPNIKFVIGDEAIHADLIEKFNLQESKGDVALVCLNEKSQKFIFDSEDSFDEDEIDDFINKFLEKKLKPTYKSEIEPKNNSNKLVKVFVGSTIGTILEENKDKDVVAFFYKEDCENCLKFNSLFTKLAKHFVKDRKLLFGKMNVDINEYPSEYEAKDYPAMFIRKSNENRPYLFDYTKENTVEDLIMFIKNVQKSDELLDQENEKFEKSEEINDHARSCKVMQDAEAEETDKTTITDNTVLESQAKNNKEDEIMTETKQELPKDEQMQDIIPEKLVDSSKIKRVKVVSERKVEL